ncbi:4'-phosphopantetheinyl transferase family protein [Cohnella suwonensis]|uniref:4'-phosphopantetheinyl transferase family protein n=1 Tax=Cohnella suwonensis TaxID=696072 RepID=A0ABW0M3N7_9BACL
MVNVFAVKMTKPLSADLFMRLADDLPNDRRERLRRFRRDEDAQRTLLADILIRYLIRMRLGISMTRASFQSNEFGKPFLEGRSDFHFNLTHSGHWIAAAVHDRPVGIDVERIRAIDLSIASRYFTREECDSIFNMPETLRLERFYEIWACKESYVKAEGRGLSIPLQSFSVRFQGELPYLQTQPSSVQRALRLYAMEGHRMAVCAETDLFPQWPTEWTSEELAASYLVQ